MATVNLANTLGVKLNSSGIKILHDLHHSEYKENKAIGEFKLPLEDDFGYNKFLGYDLMHKFAHYMDEEPFDSDITLKPEDTNKSVSFNIYNNVGVKLNQYGERIIMNLSDMISSGKSKIDLPEDEEGFFLMPFYDVIKIFGPAILHPTKEPIDYLIKIDDQYLKDDIKTYRK